MAFIGIFFVAWLLVIILIGVAFVFFFIYIPAVVLAIINLVQGVKHNWPKRNIIFVSVTAPIVIIITALLIYYFVWRFTIYVPPYGDSSSSDVTDQAYFVCQYLKYFIIQLTQLNNFYILLTACNAACEYNPSDV